MQNEIDKVSKLNKKPSLLLHSCCAPCSSSVIEFLLKYFDISVYFYNPNIYPEDEFSKRLAEQNRLCKEFFKGYNINVIETVFDSNEFYMAVNGYENSKEGGKRCSICYSLRLEKTAIYAKENNFDYFTSTLSVSPLKDAQRLNSIGEMLGNKYGVKYLYNDFKKKDGYKRSCEISSSMGMYRQDWCGCVFSLQEREKRIARRESEPHEKERNETI